ncbi:zinc finger associated protein [Popillia japonica]|uniref:Zinc finger associated protein n=1 Tax=Popillia japonica TaxID=7064 RepID=A0AAW1KG61_POPJA
MLRTPPRVTPSFSRLPLPESPENLTNQACDGPTHDARPNDDTLTPRNLGLPHSEEDLSDDEILAQIKRLQAMLLKRRNRERSTSNDKPSREQNSDEKGSPSGVSPLTMDTFFGSTSSLVSAVHRNIGRKRKGSSSPASSPARRIRVLAEIHAPVDAEPSGSNTPPFRPAFDRKATRPLRPSADADDAIVSIVAGRSNKITVLHSQPEALPMGGSTRDQRSLSRSNLRGKTLQTPHTCGEDPPPPLPVVLRDKTGWSKLSAEIKRRGINFTKAQNVTDGIRIFPSTASDHRTLTKFFSNDGIPHHTYQLPSEKLLDVVVRGIPQEIAEEEIFNDFRERGFTPQVVARMRRSRDRAPMPLVLVKVPREQKTIYHLEEVLSLEVTVEALKANAIDAKGSATRSRAVQHQGNVSHVLVIMSRVPAHVRSRAVQHQGNVSHVLVIMSRVPAHVQSKSRQHAQTVSPGTRPAMADRTGGLQPSRARAQESSGSYSVKKDKVNNGRSYSQVLSNTQRTHPQGKTSKSPKVGFISGMAGPILKSYLTPNGHTLRGKHLNPPKLERAVVALVEDIRRGLESATSFAPPRPNKWLPNHIRQLLTDKRRAKKRAQQILHPADVAAANRLAKRIKEEPRSALSKSSTLLTWPLRTA